MKLRLLLILILATLTNVFAQKSAPVAGDAAELMDLLKKDYNAVDPELRNETISKDMFRVTSIFKSYLTDIERDVDKGCEDFFDKLIKVISISEEQFVVDYVLFGIDVDNDDDSTKIAKFCLKVSELQEAFESYNKQKLLYNNERNQNRLNDTDIRNYEAEKKNYYLIKFYSDLISFSQLSDIYENSKNTYLSHVLELFIKKYSTVFFNKEDFSAQVNYSSSIQKSLPFLGGDLTFETIIDGLSRFLAKRIKEELTTHAIEKIQNYLNNPSQESYLNELIVLLPETTDYIKSFEASQVLNFTDDFKQYIEKDLNNLLANASNLQTTPRFEKLIKNNPDIGFAFEALDLIPQISKIKEPLDYFEILENSPNLQRWAENSREKIKFNIANTIKLTSLLAHSLLVIDDGKQKLVSLDFMSNYGSEKEFYFLYIGFLNQQQEKYFKVQFVKDDYALVNLKFKKLMENVTPDNVTTTETSIKFIKNHINHIVTNVEKIQSDLENIKKANKNNEKIEITQVHSVVGTLIEFSEALVNTVDDILIKGQTLHFLDSNIDENIVIKKTKPYFETAKSVNDIFLDLHNKNYTTAIISALEISSNFSKNKVSISAITNLSNALEVSKNIKVLKTFLSTTKIPNSDKKKKDLKDLAVIVEQIVNYPLDPKLANIKIQFKKVDNAIKADSNEDFKKEIEKLKTEFLSDFEEVFNEYTDVDLTNSIILPIEEYIDNSGLKANIQSQLKGCLKSLIKNTYNAYLLNDSSKLEESKEEFLRYFNAYLPELTKKVFKIKDHNVLKIVHFITDIAVSKNSEDVEAALEAFALPAGSSSAKEKTSTYVSINSYPGILAGFEFSDSGSDKDAEHLGITAPIGIYGQFFETKKGSFGFFVPIIDIGAPVRLRLDNDSNTETLPDFNIKDIFSPGLYLSYGFNNSPFAINAGVQYGPKLRDIDNGAGVFNDIESYRVSLGLVIDIPLFTLFNRGVD